MTGPRLPIADRFWAKVDRSGGLLACWPWTGGLSSKRNYPSRPVFFVCRLPGTSGQGWRTRSQLIVPAARMALSLTDGVPLHDRMGLHACHRVECSNPRCCNPAHLYWGTPEENRADRYPSLRVENLGDLIDD